MAKIYTITFGNDDSAVATVLYELHAWNVDPKKYTVDTLANRIETRNSNVVDVITESLEQHRYSITRSTVCLNER